MEFRQELVYFPSIKKAFYDFELKHPHTVDKASPFYLLPAGKKRYLRLKKYLCREEGWGGNFTFLNSLYVFFMKWQK
jgi:hypothetical protein